MKQMLLIVFLMPLLVSAQAQENAKGINWTTGLSWAQVKQKAKEENKYIFLDCYTTWCPPCKKMDEVVYPDKTVGEYFNDKFISVKVQLDKSDKDNELVQRWYQDAEVIGKLYHIDAYPTFIFLSPQGKVVEKEMGFKEPPAFVDLAKGATQTGKVYEDPYEEYGRFAANYKSGRIDYNKISAMIPVAEKFGDNEMAQKLYADFKIYAKRLPKHRRYTKENIALWNIRGFNMEDPVYKFFLKDGRLIDKVIGAQGFSANVLDNIVMREITAPFFKVQYGFEVNQGMGVGIIDQYGHLITDKNPKPDSTEADWKKLEKELRTKLSRQWAKRSIEEARQVWYEKHNNWNAYAINYLNKLKRRGADFYLNNCAFNIFLHVDDISLINQLLPWVKKSITEYSDSHEIDTYANLLYKAGKLQEALIWENKASDLAGNQNAYYLMVIEKMKKGEPTWD